jgi:hypothetical protein
MCTLWGSWPGFLSSCCWILWYIQVKKIFRDFGRSILDSETRYLCLRMNLFRASMRKPLRFLREIFNHKGRQGLHNGHKDGHKPAT